MIVRQLQDILNTERDVQTETWASRRLLLQEDGMGFSMHETTIFAWNHGGWSMTCLAGISLVFACMLFSFLDSYFTVPKAITE